MTFELKLHVPTAMPVFIYAGESTDNKAREVKQLYDRTIYKSTLIRGAYSSDDKRCLSAVTKVE